MLNRLQRLRGFLGYWVVLMMLVRCNHATGE